MAGGNAERDVRLPKVAVCIAAFNRRDTTLSCLELLNRQTGRDVIFETRLYLLDDGSIDGTADAVREKYPEVILLQGTGSLFWGGGMFASMSAAISDGADFYLLLNDDVELLASAIQQALSTYHQICCETGEDKHIVVGATISKSDGGITYSGFMRTSKIDPSKLKRVPPFDDKPRQCDTMNGNFVIVPKIVADRLGAIDHKFVHQLGDIDYGYRAIKAGSRVWVAPKPIGSCEANLRKLPFQKSGLSLAAKWKAINSPLGMPVKSWTLFMWRHGGLLGLVKLLLIYVKKMMGK